MSGARARAERAERESARLRTRLRLRPRRTPFGQITNGDPLRARPHRDEWGGARSIPEVEHAQVMAHLRERVRLPGDERPEDIAEHHVCPGCYAVDGPCLPGCIDAEIAADRERERSSGPAWEDEEDD